MLNEKEINKVAFLDRDGTINYDLGYIYKIEDFKWIPGAKEAIKYLKENQYKVVIVTNQSGISKNLYTEKDIEKLHEWINQELQRDINYKIDAFYFCPHSSSENCECRKPKPGMLKKAIQDFSPVDLSKSFLIGDNIRDVTAAFLLNIKGYIFIGDNLLDFIINSVKLHR